MKVFELIAETWEDEFGQKSENKLSVAERLKLLTRRQMGLEHQVDTIRNRREYVLRSLAKKGKILNSEDPVIVNRPIEQTAKFLHYLRTMGRTSWYVFKTPENAEFIKKLESWLVNCQANIDKIQELQREIKCRLKGLRSAQTRMSRKGLY